MNVTSLEHQNEKPFYKADRVLRMEKDLKGLGACGHKFGWTGGGKGAPALPR